MAVLQTPGNPDDACMAVPADLDDRRVVYPLTPMDGNPVSRANLQFVFFYALDTAQKSQLRPTLRSAFYKTMAQYPILYGKMEQVCGTKESTRSTVQVVVTRKHAETDGMPLYEEHHQVEQTVAQIRDSGYNWSMWPPQLMKIPVARGTMATQVADAPLVQCIVTWLSDGLGILFSVDHSIVDGVGIDILINKWAQTARGLQEPSVSLSSPPSSPLSAAADFDHHSFYRDVLRNNNQPKDDWFVQYIDTLDMPAHVPANAIVNQNLEAVEQALQTNVHSLRITPESLARLHKDMNESGTAANPLSAIRLAYALVWQRYMIAKNTTEEGETQQQQQQQTSSDTADTGFLNIIHNARHLVSRPHYIGNAVCPTYMRLPVSCPSAESPPSPSECICEIAQTIGTYMHATSRSQWLAFCHRMLDPVWFPKFLTVFANPKANQLTVSNISRLSFYDADFGFGAPLHATLYPTLIPGFTTWLPMGPAGGLHILWNIPLTVLDVLAKDQLFCRYVDIVF
ncbi:hypothetical protein LPJ72_002430 [Coemansia sp. Benny D160-2]|nr:hypothetical protein LPJ72_002430 [Coemansia sp. Benny D160-2]